MRILFIGDIVAKLGRKAVSEILPSLVEEEKVDLVIANVENLSHGKGATPQAIDEIRGYGVDIMTSGNHIWFREETYPLLENDPTIIRPANYPGDVAGFGFTIATVSGKEKVLVVNLLGRLWIPDPTEDPFRTIDEIIADQCAKEKFAAIIVDFHAEATSEKMAMGWYLDGRVTLVAGTHTHIPTSDTWILPKGTAYVSDVGMTGAQHSVLGVDPETIIKAHKYPYPQKFEWVETGPKIFSSVFVETDKKGMAKSIKRIDKILE
ncbi:MAG: TIGR00282 family metallophosphoesterase [Patescibacteria group bacterium]|nr:TIGR00282 family metallophosphoesterase [Patescibacteria group bacterium]